MAPLANNRFIEIGRIGKPRGLDGVVRFMPNENFTDGLFEQAEILYMRNSRSDLVPARIMNVHTEEKRNQQTFFVKFDMITGRSDAEAAMNRALFADRNIIESLLPEVYSAEKNAVVGYTIWYDGIEFGKILNVIENPAHPIIETRQSIGSLLIPMVEEYVEKTDHEKQIVYCKNLNQLTDL